jgi:pimeloyl-ACP methyl ester carboxylesterase
VRLRRLFLLALLAAAAAAAVVFWPWIDAQRRATVLLSSTSPTPVLSWAVRLVTADPRTEQSVLAGVPTTIVRAGGGRRPAIVLVPGTVDGGRSNQRVLRLAGGLARAGYLVLVPDLPGMADGEIVGATVQAAVAVALAAVRRDDVRGGKVALAGAWAGASVALLAAEDPTLAPRVSVVAGVAPWTAVPNLLRLATTGFVLDRGGLEAYKADPYVSLVAGRSLVAALRPSTARTDLLAVLRGVVRNDPDPLRALRGVGVTTLPPDAAAVVRLLANTSASSFDGLYAALPDYLHTEVERLSPLVGASALDAPVELATSAHDRFVPPGEAQALRRESSRIRVTVSGGLASGLPDPSFGEAFATDAFVVRVLRDAG